MAAISGGPYFDNSDINISHHDKIHNKMALLTHKPPAFVTHPSDGAGHLRFISPLGNCMWGGGITQHFCARKNTQQN